jgi:rare lipoprotein A
VTNLENGRSVVVRVNDRGPFKNGRVMDVSMRAAELLGFANKGTARVRLEVLEKESRILADASRRGENTTRMTLADLQGQEGSEGMAAGVQPSPVPALQPVTKLASSSEGEDSLLPESLRTPTIMVEDLKAPAGKAADGIVSVPPSAAYTPPPKGMAQGHVKAGRFMPSPVVSTVPVHATGIFVQAGSFSVRDNAEGLKRKLGKIAPSVIEPVSVNGRSFYRVKLGPIASIDQADRVLDKVIRAGQSSAKVVTK